MPSSPSEMLAAINRDRESAERELVQIAADRSELQRRENAARKRLVDAKILANRLARRSGGGEAGEVAAG